MKNTIGYALTALVSVLALAGCGKNDSGSNPQVVGQYGYANCAGCIGNNQMMTQAVSQRQDLGEQLQLQFYTQTQMTYQTSLTSGYTQVAAQGILTLGPTAQQYCGIPAGQYQVSTSGAPSVMQNGNIYNMTMIANGPTQLQFVIKTIHFLDPNHFQTNGYVVGPTGVQCPIAYY